MMSFRSLDRSYLLQNTDEFRNKYGWEHYFLTTSKILPAQEVRESRLF